MGHFVYAAKAFDVLERLDPDPEYWEGKRGACIGQNYDPFDYTYFVCILSFYGFLYNFTVYFCYCLILYIIFYITYINKTYDTTSYCIYTGVFQQLIAQTLLPGSAATQGATAAVKVEDLQEVCMCCLYIMCIVYDAYSVHCMNIM